MADKYDERNRQGKALERWEQQQKMWAKLTANLAKKVGKEDPSQTLQGTIHHYRQRQEECTVLDASVPPEIKSGHHAWEMNLRNYDTNATGRAGGGFRYVQFGIPYPYPLYVPVKDGVSTDPESNTLTRVVVEGVPKRHKPISESPYYHSRELEYKKHIKRIFSHFVPGQEGLVVVGRPPPLINSKELSDGTTEEAFQPVVFYPPPEPRAPEEAAAKSPTPPPTAHANGPDGVRSRSSIAPSDASAAEEKKKALVGPALTISAASLVAKVRPGELAQLTLCAANAGSTAIFYQWAARERDPVPGLTDTPPVVFDMADVPTGVLLPGDQKLFTFSYRPTMAGSFSQTMDLNTVPSGKERILVHLQVFAISEDENPAVTSGIDAACSRKSLAGAFHSALWAPISSPINNAFTKSDITATTRLLDALRQKKDTDHASTIAKERCVWKQNNSLSREVLPPATCPLREAYAHQVLTAKENGRSGSSLGQQAGGGGGGGGAKDKESREKEMREKEALAAAAAAAAAAPDAGCNVPLPPLSAAAIPSNAAVFSPEALRLPFTEVTYKGLKDLFANLQHFKHQCVAVREAAARLEPHPPPVASLPEGGRPKSGGAAAAKAQQQALLLQQQQYALAQQQTIERERLKEELRNGDGSTTPRRGAGAGRVSVLAPLIHPSASNALNGGSLAVAATVKVLDPQLAQVSAQESALERAIRTFDNAIVEGEKMRARDAAKAKERAERGERADTATTNATPPATTPTRVAATPPRSQSPVGAGNASPVAAGPASPVASFVPNPLGLPAPPLIGPSHPLALDFDRCTTLEWDGSVRMLLEEISHVRDNTIRNEFLRAAQLLLRASAAATEGEANNTHVGPASVAPRPTLTTLLERVAVSDAFDEAVSSLEFYAITANGLCDAKTLGRKGANGAGGTDGASGGAGKGDKGGKGGQPGPGKKGAAASNAGGNSKANTNDAAFTSPTTGNLAPPTSVAAASVSGAAISPSVLNEMQRLSLVADAFYAGAANIYEDFVTRQIKLRRERYLALLAGVCSQPVTIRHERRMEMIRQELLSPHADVDTAVETTKKKR